MNLLIVDDEYYSAESTRKRIAQKGPVFDEIFCAYSMERALEYMEGHAVSILILDVEMPGGSGLELLDYIRQKGMDTICIFLTAYAKFEYLSKAMRLTIIDYLLKPVEEEELLSAVRRAVDQFRRQNSEKQRQQEANYWRESELYLWELFWMDLASGAVSSRTEEIQKELARRKLNSAAVDLVWLPLLIECNGMDRISEERDLHEFLVKNIVREYFYNQEEIAAVVCLGRKFYLLPLPEAGHERQDLIDRCRQALEEFVPRFPHTFNFYVTASGCRLADFKRAVGELMEAADGNVALENHVIDLAQKQRAGEEGQSGICFDVRRWSDFLLSRRIGRLRAELDLLLASLAHSDGVTREALSDFYYSFLQLLFRCVEVADGGEKLPSFRKRIAGLSGDMACSSVANLKEWIAQVCTLYEECVTDQRRQGEAVVTVRNYIRDHLDQDMTREFLAAMVYLTPDYLSHLFKRETGFALNNYVIYERIMEARKLLAGTKLSISEVATRCGFQNISYFSRQFKRFTGMTPREFRQ